MKRKELMQWVLAVVIVAAAIAIFRLASEPPKANAAEGAQSMAEQTECS